VPLAFVVAVVPTAFYDRPLTQGPLQLPNASADMATQHARSLKNEKVSRPLRDNFSTPRPPR
jgi:hypothetical protein